MPEYDFDAVFLERESSSEAVLRVEVDNFTPNDQAKSFLHNGVLKISANVDGKDYSKTIDGLTDKDVEVIDTKKSRGSFKVVLKKRKDFKVSEVIYNG